MTETNRIVTAQRAYFALGKTRSLAHRVRALEALRNAIVTHEQEILDALQSDLHKAPVESYATEIGIVLEEISFALRHVRRWARPQRKRMPLVHFPASSRVYAEPYGTVLVMAPWNYPFQLTINPLVGALAAGNTCVLKPSAYAPATARVIQRLIGEVFEPAYVAVVQGGRDANQSLLKEPFDLIFFTGGPAVGKVVMHAAAEHLTPVVLELGGKSPCVVERSAHVRVAAKRIAWGKFLNAGQTCVAPDYLLVQESVADELVAELRRAIVELYGRDPLVSPDYPKIVNTKHFNRLCGLMEHGEVVEGGQTNRATCQIAPTILTNVGWEDPIMQEEIFGPLLPVLTFGTMDEVYQMLAQRPKPLAFYLFTRDASVEREAMERVSFGGGCINDTVVHLANPSLPFGGVGASGMGCYHGAYSFQTFSHQKGVVKKSSCVDIPVRYAPYGKKLPLMRRLMG